jgi:hypothetical protein
VRTVFPPTETLSPARILMSRAVRLRLFAAIIVESDGYCWP